MYSIKTEGGEFPGGGYCGPALVKWITSRGHMMMMENTSDLARPGRAKKVVNDWLASGSFKPLIAKALPGGQPREEKRS
jgi:hypothetical protein